MKTKYPLGRQFGIWAKFTPSLSRGFLRLAAWAMPLLPKGLPRKKVRMARMDAGGVRAYLIEGRACGKDAPCLVYFHGGGFVFGGAPYHYRNAAAYALGAGCKVLFAEYPLAPAHPFPAPNAACLQVYRFACTHARELGIDGERIAVGGDSAGGFLAADTVFRAQEAGLAPPCFAMLVYPVIGGGETPSMRRFPDTPMWNARLNARMWEYYGGDARLAVPEGSGLQRFPATYIETAEFDCLHDEGVRFAHALGRAGVAVTLNETKGTMHGFDAASKSAAAKQASEARICALRRAFSVG